MKKLSLVLSLVLFAFGTMLAQRTISGTISDTDGEPLIGASILVKGTTSGTVTDFDGTYSLNVPDGTHVLIISYTGYSTQEIETGASNILDVALEEGIKLSEVVVTALGVSREKKTLGYSVQEVGGEETSEVRETNFIASLSGKVSGVSIKQPNTMGGSANVIIRGSTSLTGNNQALFVVDGVPIDNANLSDNQSNGGGYDYGNMAMDINPDDIESISILKGAAASALYGSRAANGVVLISTKKGVKGKKGIGVSVNSGLMMSTIDKSTGPQWQKEYGGGYGPFYEDPTANFFYADIDGDGIEDLIAPTSEDASWGEKFDPNLMVVHWDALDPAASNYGEKRPWVAGENDWTHFFSTGQKWTNNVAIDGGWDNGSFRLSYTNVDEKGILPNSKIKRNTINFSARHDLTEKLSVDANITYANTDAVGRYGTGYDGGNPMQSFSQWVQTNVDFARLEEKWQRADGSQLSWNHGYYDDLHPIYFDNPYWVRNKSYQDDNRDRIFGVVGARYDFTDWLSLQARFGIDQYALVRNERIAKGSVDVSDFTSRRRNFKENNTDLVLRANKTFGDFSVSAMVGSNFRQTTTQSTTGSTVGGLVVPNLYTVSNSVSPVSHNESLVERGTNSALGSVSVGYKNFLYLEFSDRYDVSSTLPDEHNAYNYYGISGSVILSELGGLNNLRFLSFAKLRANYAEVGNDASAYRTVSTYSQGTNWNDLTLFSVNSTLQNPNLRPERTKSYEIGLEASFLQNRFSFDVAAYKSNTFDQIMSTGASPSSGISSRWVNGGEIENKGVEISLNGTPVRTNDFSWDIGVNWFMNRNKVISLYEDVQNILLYSNWDVSINAAVGEPYGTIKGTDFVYTNGQKTVSENGYYMKSDAGDEVIGNINPDWNMGISSKINFKGITLRALFDFQKGGDIYSINTKYGQATGVYQETAGLNAQGNPKRDRVADGGGVLFDAVNEDGSPNTTYVEAYRWGRAFYYNNSPTARYVLDASYVKLREIALAYSLPKSIVGKTPLTEITVSLVGRNLAILSKNVDHFDPEFSAGSGNRQGIESGAYPTTRNIGFNIKLGF